jgi:hypothetical protein
MPPGFANDDADEIDLSIAGENPMHSGSTTTMTTTITARSAHQQQHAGEASLPAAPAKITDGVSRDIPASAVARPRPPPVTRDSAEQQAANREEDDASHSSSSVTIRGKMWKSRGGNEEEGGGHGMPTREISSPVTVTSPVMVNRSSERPMEVDLESAGGVGNISEDAGDDALDNTDRRSNDLGVSIRALAAVSRLRIGVRHSHRLLAKRMGTSLMVCSVIHAVAFMIVSFRRDEAGELCVVMSKAVSISSFIFHAAMVFAYDGMRFRCASHYCILAMDSIIGTVDHLIRGEVTSAVSRFVVWSIILYPLGGWGVYELLHAAQNFDMATRGKLSHSALLAFSASVMPMLYFSLNGVLCVAFSDEYLHDCAVRTRVNFVAMLAVLGNAVMVMLLSIHPVSLKQVTHLDIPAPQLVAFALNGTLSLLALVIHSQNETVGMVSRPVEYMFGASGPCLILFIIAFAVSIVQQSRTPAGSRTSAITALAPVATVNTAQYGAMIPHRILMVAFTLLYILLVLCDVGEMVCSSVAPLSAASTVFHFIVTVEEASVGRTVIFHYFTHVSSAVVIGIRALHNGNQVNALKMFMYLVIVYPAVCIAVTRFCSTVRSHDADSSAAKLVAVSFVTFWSAVVPVVLYLAADSLGASPHVQCTTSMLTLIIDRDRYIFNVALVFLLRQDVCSATPAIQRDSYSSARTEKLRIMPVRCKQFFSVPLELFSLTQKEELDLTCLRLCGSKSVGLNGSWEASRSLLQ